MGLCLLVLCVQVWGRDRVQGSKAKLNTDWNSTVVKHGIAKTLWLYTSSRCKYCQVMQDCFDEVRRRFKDYDNIRFAIVNE